MKSGLRCRKNIFFTLPALFPIILLLISCQTGGGAETPLPFEVPADQRTEVSPPPATGSGGVVDEIRFYTERATPSALINALDIIDNLDLGSTDFGRVMTAVNVTLLQTLYPGVLDQLPAMDPPLIHSYSQILRDVEIGVYTTPHINSTDFLEHVLPFLSLYSLSGRRILLREDYSASLSHLERAARLNSESVLPYYFLGIAYERSGRLGDALRQFNLTWEMFGESYPAALGIVRVMEAQGRQEEAMGFLSELALRFPDNLQIKRLLAMAYYRSGDWFRAATVAEEILSTDSADGEFILVLAHCLVEQGRLLEAQVPLDRYTSIDPNNRLYHFLRARVQAEAFNNRDAALNHLRAIIRTYPADRVPAGSEAELYYATLVYATRLLLESPRPGDQAEGRAFLDRLLAVPFLSLEATGLVLEDLVRQEAWEEARVYLPRLLAERRSSRDLLAAYAVERGLGNVSSAFSFAQELFVRDRLNEDGRLAYISALIDVGRREEAAGMIESSLNTVPRGELRSRYYYLRSRIRASEAMAMEDLHSSLFEDPRNLQALIALFEIHHSRGDEMRALFHLRQALALAQNNLRLKAYQAEYDVFTVP